MVIEENLRVLLLHLSILLQAMRARLDRGQIVRDSCYGNSLLIHHKLQRLRSPFDSV